MSELVSAEDAMENDRNRRDATYDDLGVQIEGSVDHPMGQYPLTVCEKPKGQGRYDVQNFTG